MVYEHFRGELPAAAGLIRLRPLISVTGESRPMAFRIWRAWRDYGFNVTGEHAELPEVVEAAGGSWNLFSVLGMQPQLGRMFTPEEDQPGANHVVLLTWDFFQRRFGGNASVIGTQLRLDTNPYTIIGVLPRWFNYPSPHVALWVPYAATFTPEQYAGA